MQSLLIANRGEIAIRVAAAADGLGLQTTAVYSEDDAQSLHTRRAGRALPLRGTGAAAYLDARQLVALAKEAGCDAIHPGYGFLSENGDFARLCGEQGIRFVGPRPETLDRLGDKVEARALAAQCGVPLLPGSDGPVSLEQARDFLDSLPGGESMLIKAVAGGGGRGLRVVSRAEDLDSAYARCRSEAEAAFGRPEVYAERFLPGARHVEVQVAGDGTGAVSHLWERDCTVQRRHQKLVEIAPAPGLAASLREGVLAAAVQMAREVDYLSLGTFEFLVDPERFAFIEANARLQVEHTVTEAVTGVDLVQAQLRLADGETLDAVGLAQDAVPEPRGHAVQVRVNLETMGADGEPKPTGGTLSAFEVPSGPGVRTDTYGYAGYATNPRYDSLLAKVIGYSPSPEFAHAVTRTYRALCEFRIEGVDTNIAFLQAILRSPDFRGARVHTRFVEDHAAELSAGEDYPELFFAAAAPAGPAAVGAVGAAEPPPALAGASIDSSDPLAVLDHGRSAGAPSAATQAAAEAAPAPAAVEGPEGTVAVRAPLQGTIVSVEVRQGDRIHADQALLVMEAMKMEHVIRAGVSGVVRVLAVAEGDAVYPGHVLAFVEPAEVENVDAGDAVEVDLDRIRPDLAEVHERHEVGLDPARPEAVARRRKTGQRTTRENVDDLCDTGSFIEYGPLVLAAQRRRRSVEELIARTPADGLVAGVGTVNADRFGEDRSRCAILSYDYTVLAGTQGAQNHRKKDRLFELAEKWRLPLVFFTEGGGGRPGDTDGLGVAGLDCLAFTYFGRLSGLVPLVGINSGRCFAGNAALLGCCDVVIATANSNIGMGGPAMIEGGGLGVFRPEEVGPMDVQVP
ncbi:MAG: biotin/lipoyl-binding protein, partial [Deltaproteobacteria bacterium]|nr:biotin/lipoyl-binding protein [Deltaproteobacteria bacterium]